MKMRTRAGSTAFQVWPVDLEVGADDTAVGHTQHIGDIVEIDAGIGEDRHILDRLGNLVEADCSVALAGDGARDEDRIGERGEDRAAGAQAQRPRIQRGREFRIDVEQQFEVAHAQIPPRLQRAVTIRHPEPHVGGIDAGEDFAHEFGARGGGDRDARHRIPQVVHAEGHTDAITQEGDDCAHRGDGADRRLQRIGPVVLVAEHDRIDAAILQRLQIHRGLLDEAVHAGLLVIQRRARQGADMHHADDDFLLAVKEIEHLLSSDVVGLKVP